MNPNSAVAVAPDLELDAWLEPFELAAESGSAPDLADYLPDPTHPKYAEVLRELVRIDLEFAWSRGDERRIEEYTRRFPILLHNPAMLGDVAMEEFRQRRTAGEDPDPLEYRRRFGIDLPLGVKPDQPPDVNWEGNEFPAIGDVVAPGYRIVSELGRGAFGRVYLAEQADLANRKVAIKISSRLIGEAQTLARLQHTHIVPIYSVHRAGAYQVLVMPYLGGATLADVLASVRIGPSGRATERAILTAISIQKGKIPAIESAPPASEPVGAMLADRVLEIGIDLADGLAHAHGRGILHRDIKPANILLTDDGEPMLLDFNLATDDRELPASVGGTPRYMAPEQFALLDDASVRVDGRADVYSLGLVLHELLTGRLPFPERTGSWSEISPLMLADRQRLPDIRLESPALASILRKCLEPEPIDRYASAADLRDDLSRQRENQPLKTAPEPLSRERARKWIRRHPRLASSSTVALVASLLVLVIALAAYSIWREKTELHAREARTHLGQARLEAQMLAVDPAGPDEQFRTARQRVLEALKPYSLPDKDDWLDGRNVRRLPAADAEALRAEAADLLYWGAVASAHLARREPDAMARKDLIDEALLLNDRARAAYPSPNPIHPLIAQRAAILELAGRATDAANLREQLAGASVPGGSGELLRAQMDIQAKRYSEAIATLEKLATQEQPSFSVWYALGVARLKACKYERAADAFLAAGALRPDLARPYLYRGVALLAAHRLDAAIDSLGQFIDRRPNDAEGYLNRAIAGIQRGDASAALADLTEAERCAGSPTRVHGLRERAWRVKGDTTKAAESHRLLLATEPDDLDGWTIRGEAKMAGDSAGALADFDAALRMEPDHVPALRGKASCLSERLNRPADAAAVLERIVKLGAASVDDRAGYSVLLARLGRTDDARKQARACLGPETPALPLYQAASALALTATTATDRSEAIVVLRHVLQRDASWASEMATDTDLRAIRQDKDFQALITAGRVIAGSSSR